MRVALSEEQERAAGRRGEALLSAGAGSGKTAVLVERFVRAVIEDGVHPARILAITFTERAAGELRERVRGRLLEEGAREAARDTEGAFVGTFHGFCARVLRAHPLAAGVEPGFAILDEGLASQLRARAFAGALSELMQRGGEEAVELAAAYGPDRVRAIVAATYAELRTRGEERPRLPAPRAAHDEGDATEADAARACALLAQLLEGFGARYEELKRARGALDFDDLELRALALLREHPGVRTAWSERFELLMVDEFQDTNARQLEILRALERENLFTVGDELQAIYGFRHAEVRLFQERRVSLAQRDASLRLRLNHRSVAPLIEAVNAVFGARVGAAYTPLEAARMAQNAPAVQLAVELLLVDRAGSNGCAEGAHWREHEARALAGRVAALIGAGEAHAGQVAVLLRALGDIELYEAALRERGIATLAAAGGFWERGEVRELLAYLSVLANPLDELALYGTLASPLAGISSDGLARIARTARGRGARELWATLESADGRQSLRLPRAEHETLKAFCAHLADARRAVTRSAPSQLLERVLSQSAYGAALHSGELGERRAANVHKLLHLARRFEASEGRELRAFLDHAVHSRELGSGAEAEAPVARGAEEAVRVMSIHAAKGLEFEVVCVADLGRTPNLTTPDLLIDGSRVGLRHVRLDGGEPELAFEYEQLCEERRAAQAAEEDRILYVGMTRARERLLLSGAVNFARWPQARAAAPPIAWLGPALVPGLRDAARATAEAREPRALELAAAGSAGRVRVQLYGAPSLAIAAMGVEPGSTETPDGAPTDSAEGGPTETPDGALDGAPTKTPDRARVTKRPPIRVPAIDGAHVAARATPRRAADQQPPAPAQLPETLSYTALAELERCGYRFYAERVLGLRAEGGGRPSSPGTTAGDAVRKPTGIGGRARGTLVHRLLESGSPPPSPQRVRDVARELGIHLAASESEEIGALLTDTLGSAAEGPAPAPLARMAAAASVRREHPFAFALDPSGPLLTGVLDVLARELDGGALVLDYKTDRVHADEDLSLRVEREYSLQRDLYALAVLREGAASVEVVHWFLERAGGWVSTRFGADDVGALEARLRGRVAAVRARGFSVSERPHRALCEGCPARRGLCSHSEAQTLRETVSA